MADIHFDKPVLDARKSPEQNIAILDRWAAELVNSLNLFVSQINKEMENGNQI